MWVNEYERSIFLGIPPVLSRSLLKSTENDQQLSQLHPIQNETAAAGSFQDTEL